jgi:hypothetical protein
MSEQKPNVFPKIQTPVPSTEPTPNVSVDTDYTTKRMEVAQEVYTNSKTDAGFDDAVEAMRIRTEEQVRLRNEALKKNIDATKNYETQFNSIMDKPKPQQEQPKVIVPTKQTITTPIQTSFTMNTNDSYIQQLSQPQYNMSFDVLPLPSGGKIYKNKKSAVKVAYMTTADENILTSPNLVSSGQFLEILINRKLLENDIRYRDLHVGDRNAIMLWLRATSYGEMYPVTLLDENDVPFDTEVNLNDLKVIKLGAEPDSEGYFDFTLPVSKIQIKFKLLTVGDIEDIEKQLEIDKENGVPVNNTNTYALERQLIEVNSERNKGIIKDFIQTMRVGDAKGLRNYIDSIESGVDLNIEVGTPGGGSIKTFLPLNFRFFWPDISI